MFWLIAMHKRKDSFVFLSSPCTFFWVLFTAEMVLTSIPSPRINAPAAENFGSDASHLQVFKFANIKGATNNFSSANKLGEGGFGPVYKVT